MPSGSTMSNAWMPQLTRRERIIEIALASFGLVLSGYFVAQSLHFFAGRNEYQPLRGACLSGALALQPISRLVRRRSAVLAFTLIAFAVVLMVASLVVTD